MYQNLDQKSKDGNATRTWNDSSNSSTKLPVPFEVVAILLSFQLTQNETNRRSYQQED